MRTIAAAAAIGGLLLTGCSSSDSTTPPASAATTGTRTSTSVTTMDTKTPLQTAADGCSVSSDVEDNGASLTFSSVGASSSSSAAPVGDTIVDVACVMLVLHAPNAVLNHIDTTRALDGMQDDTWSHYKARWTYHPDDGLNLTIIDTDLQ